jgi:hypothetical protein
VTRVRQFPSVTFDPLPSRRSPHPAALLIDSASARAVKRLAPTLAVVSVSGRMTVADADRVAAVSTDWVYVWPSVAWHPDDGPHPEAAAITRLLHGAGVDDVLIVAHAVSDRPEVLIEKYGPERAARRIGALLDGAGYAGAYQPDNPYDHRNAVPVAA